MTRLDIPSLNEEQTRKFYLYIEFDETDVDSCWVWTGPYNDSGYAVFFIGRTTFRASRISYKHFREDFDKTLDACHKCDNPACVNPWHLFLGTDLDNHRDALAKGRHSVQITDVMRRRGSDHYLAKLTDQNVRDIRLAEGKQRDIARIYGTTQAQVWRIKNGKAWAHVK